MAGSALLLTLALAVAGSASNKNNTYTNYLGPPNGIDDALDPQDALDDCVINRSSGCTIHLNIHLYNLAEVSSRTLDHATQDAARVLATAGVNAVRWRVLADAPEAHTVDLSVLPTWRKNSQADSRGYVVVIIERGYPDNYLPDELGYALPDGQIGVNATVFYDRIEWLHASAEIDPTTLLGHAMAHEIGHVLLGTTEHSTTGIMKARWNSADFQVAGLRFMNFTTLQRAEVRRRLLISMHATFLSLSRAQKAGDRPSAGPSGR